MSEPSIVLAKATGAGNSVDFTVSGLPVNVRAYPKANLAAEVGYLKQKNPDDTYDDVYDLNGTVIALGATMPQVMIVGAGTYRVEFAARTSAIGVDILSGSK
jgi:hypothetical protein